MIDLAAVGESVLTSVMPRYFPSSAPKSVTLPLQWDKRVVAGSLRVQSEFGTMEIEFRIPEPQTNEELIRRVLRFIEIAFKAQDNYARERVEEERLKLGEPQPMEWYDYDEQKERQVDKALRELRARGRAESHKRKS